MFERVRNPAATSVGLVLVLAFTATESLAQTQETPTGGTPGTYPSWTAESNQVSAIMEGILGPGDLNGDGLADVVCSAPLFKANYAAEGIAFAYFGGSAGLNKAPSWLTFGTTSGQKIGRSMASAGDVNGDGHLDLLVGGTGRVLVFHGTATGLGTAPATVLLGAPIGDYGRSVLGIGDVNSDGYDDIAIGEPFFTGALLEMGRVHVHLGSPSGVAPTPAWQAVGPSAYDEFGVALGAGDVNGDGAVDLIVGARTLSAVESEEGGVAVFPGNGSGLASSPTWLTTSGQKNARLGASLAVADLNSDGVDDVIAGALDWDGQQIDEGRVVAYFGAASGPSAAPSWVRDGVQEGSRFGVVAAGDATGDGFVDLLVGSRLYDGSQPNEGRAQLYVGGPNGPSKVARWSVEGNQPSASFGSQVAILGDIDGDGAVEVGVGAQQYDYGQSDEGRVFVFRGNQPALTTIAAKSTSYGASEVGQNGPVVLVTTGLPRLGWPATLRVNGGPFFVPPLLFFGAGSTTIPFDGGQFLVQSGTFVLMPFVDVYGKTELTVEVPATPAIAGGHVFFQVMFPGSLSGAGSLLSNGVEWTIGG